MQKQTSFKVLPLRILKKSFNLQESVLYLQSEPSATNQLQITVQHSEIHAQDELLGNRDLNSHGRTSLWWSST